MKRLKDMMKTGMLVASLCSVTLGLQAQSNYTPTPENLQARATFSDSKFGVFLHWGIYSMFAQGEWYLHNANLDRNEYAKAASGFFPARFDAHAWVKAIKDAGAKYICFTTRHHDSFSMWATKESAYNIVDATPYGKDVLKQLADECHKQGIKLHLYYSHLDWMREDYPQGRTGHGTGRDPQKANWSSYYAFMNRQLTELLTNYGPIGAIWFDGWWDHDEDSTPFNWQLDEQYALIHRLQPACLVGNNHHQTPFPGEDIQIFERDLPGENKAGLSGQSVSRLPLETCETMNGMWGYKVTDQNYKSVPTLIHYLVNAAGKGANLLLNIGPQPNGELPAASLDRLKGIGEWMNKNGETLYGTTAGDIPVQPWGATTRKGERLFVHILKADTTDLMLPLTCKVKKAFTFSDKQPFKFEKKKDGIVLKLDKKPSDVDYIVELVTK